MTHPIASLGRRLTRWAQSLLDLGSAHARHNAAAAAALITAERDERGRTTASTPHTSRDSPSLSPKW